MDYCTLPADLRGGFRLFGFADEIMEPTDTGGMIYRCRPAHDLVVTIEASAPWENWPMSISRDGVLVRAMMLPTLSAIEKAIRDYCEQNSVI